MKICDVCKKSQKQLHDTPVASVTVGTQPLFDFSVVTRIPGSLHSHTPEVNPEIEICAECNLKVNRAIAEMLNDKFDIQLPE